MIPSPQSYMTYSPGTAEYYQALSPTSIMHSSPQFIGGDDGLAKEWVDPQNQDWNLNSSAFFWTQLQKEESQLSDVSDAVLLATDGHGRA